MKFGAQPYVLTRSGWVASRKTACLMLDPGEQFLDQVAGILRFMSLLTREGVYFNLEISGAARMRSYTPSPECSMCMEINTSPLMDFGVCGQCMPLATTVVRPITPVFNLYEWVFSVRADSLVNINPASRLYLRKMRILVVGGGVKLFLVQTSGGSGGSGGSSTDLVADVVSRAFEKHGINQSLVGRVMALATRH